MTRLLGWSALAGLVACRAELFTVRVSDRAETVVPRGTLVEALLDEVGFAEFVDMDLTTSEELQNQGVRPGDIREVTLDLFELEAIEPAGADLAFLDRVELWVEADGLPQVQIASASAFPPGESGVSFDLEAVDLTEYLVSESMTLLTVTTGHRPSEDVTVEARFELSIGVTGQGVCHQL